jgi:transposase
MSKYSTAFKLEVVLYMMTSGEGSPRVAERFSVDHATVRKWHAAHHKHGMDGLKPRYTQYSADFKLEVLRFLANHSQRETASHFNIPGSSTILTWRRLFEAGGVAALQPKRQGRSPMSHRRPPPTEMTTERATQALQEELAYLRAENAYLKKLQALVLEKQSAAKKRR